MSNLHLFDLLLTTFQTRGSPLPTAVSEVLSTAKGSTFYVLTVAGDHGIPAEAEEKPRKSKSKVVAKNRCKINVFAYVQLMSGLSFYGCKVLLK